MPSPLKLLPLLLLPLALSACKGFDLSRPIDEPPSTLQPIRYYYIDINHTIDREVIIALGGEVAIRETTGSSAKDTRVIKSHITESEYNALLNAFKGWKKLDKVYPTDVSPQIEITYDNHSVITSNLDLMPPNYLKVKAQLDQLVNFLLKAADAKTAAQAARAAENAAATQPDPQPAPTLIPQNP